MASIRVTHTLDDLESDCRKITTGARTACARAVKKNVKLGEKTEQQIARGASGPHGRLYYKRITSEMFSPLEGEWGPTGEVVGNAVGAGWRHGVNTDSQKSADIVGPKFAKDVSDIADSLFWPNS
jgi:hypothetical protein